MPKQVSDLSRRNAVYRSSGLLPLTHRPGFGRLPRREAVTRSRTSGLEHRMCFRHMSRTTNARTAGFTFLFYIAVGVASMVLSGQATGAAGTAKLAGIAQHALQIRLTVVLGLLSMMSALMLGVTLYSL